MVAFSFISGLIVILPALSLVAAVPTYHTTRSWSNGTNGHHHHNHTSGNQTSQFTPFNLVTKVTHGNSSYHNLELVGQHSGAGENIAVAIPETDGNFTSGDFVLNNTHIDVNFDAGSNLPVYSLGLNFGGFPFIEGVDGAVNQGTNINGDDGQQTSGFVIDHDGFISYTGSDFPFKTFTVCGGITLEGPPAETQLFWRSTTSKPDSVHCADVKLSVQYPRSR